MSAPARRIPVSDSRTTVRRSIQPLFAAAVIIIVTGAVVAVEPRTHYFWGEVAVAILSILVLVFRGRSLPDRVHAVTFFIGAFVLLVGFTLTIITGTSNVVAEISVLGGVVAMIVLSILLPILQFNAMALG